MYHVRCESTLNDMDEVGISGTGRNLLGSSKGTVSVG